MTDQCRTINRFFRCIQAFIKTLTDCPYGISCRIALSMLRFSLDFFGDLRYIQWDVSYITSIDKEEQ